MQERNSIADFLNPFFESLDRRHIAWSVLRGYAELPFRVEHDLDLLVPPHQLRHVTLAVQETARQRHWTWVQEPCSPGVLSFNLAKQLPDAAIQLKLDLVTGFYWRGTPYASAAYALASRLRQRNFYVLRPGAEAATTIAKEIIHTAAVREKYRARIAGLACADENAFRQVLQGHLPDQAIDALFSLCISSQGGQASALRKRLRRAVVLRSLFARPLRQTGRWITFLLQRRQKMAPALRHPQ
ncbi:MAG: hypothetical protein M3Z21_01725 [Pseudomonadota bacterium]|nr:hypothetical protein [Pseudomonadota bacterium]